MHFCPKWLCHIVQPCLLKKLKDTEIFFCETENSLLNIEVQSVNVVTLLLVIDLDSCDA